MYKWFIRKLLKFFTKREIKNQQYAIGMTSYIDKNKDVHCLILEYDTKDLGFVLSDLKELVAFWKLSNYEVYSTTQGYHVFFFWTHIPYSRLKMILNYSRCDPAFKHISKYFDYKTIRVSGKYLKKDIRYIGTFQGVRPPTLEEKELGDLKRKEYLVLKEQTFFQPEVLK